MSADSLLVVGGGPAGVTAALQAREPGAQVTLLEAGQIGGTSLNRGPAPVQERGSPMALALNIGTCTLLGNYRENNEDAIDVKQFPDFVRSSV